MGRIILGAILGFIAWSIVWLGSERILSAIWPDWYGANQTAFEAAVNNGGAFTADTTILLMNVIRGSIISVMSGYLAAVVARENWLSSIVLSFLLVAFGLFIVFISWNLIPIWYHVIFTALLIPMTILGGRLKRSASIA